MSWNYRVIHMMQGTPADQEDYFAVVEMFYDDANQPNGWGDASPSGGSLSEVRGTLETMIRALEQPVIEVCGVCHNTAPGHRPDCKSQSLENTKGRAP